MPMLRSIVLLSLALFLPHSFGQQAGGAAISDSQKAEMARRLGQGCLHAWNGYRKYAWGHNALMPLSHKPHDWYAHSLLMTPVDGLDTMILMGLKPQADKA